MSVSEKLANFNEIERTIQKLCNELGRELLKIALEGWDAELAKNRDRGAYRHKGKRRTVIKTVMGEVGYERAVYETQSADGIKTCVYLLDAAMGKSGGGFMSGLLSEQIAQASCAVSYRTAARTVSEMTGQTISHTAAWNVVQLLGKQLDIQEQKAAKLAIAHEGAGRLEAKLLFEELDGIWLYLQGKSRKAQEKSKEMKLCIAYDGAVKTGKNRYELTNKVACANFESGKMFGRRKEGAIAGTYNTDETEIRCLNGDGAVWIRESITDETVFQLSTFHRNRAVIQYVTDPDARKNILGLLYSKDIDLLLTVIEAYANSAETETARQDYLRLLEYYTSNRDGLVPYHRRGFDLPKPPEGKVYRRMGAMESNIFTILGNRMKGRRACWSINGGNNLARLLCLKFTGKLSDALQNLSSQVLPERYAEEISVNKLTVYKIPFHVGKGYNGFHQSFIPSTMKQLKELVALQPM